MVAPLNHEPILIDQQGSFEKLLNDLSRQNKVAIDTESNSLYAYQEQVCLIQFSTDSCDYLLDPLSKVDVSGLALIFESPAIEKIFHAAEYDIICLKRDYGFKFNNIFDTMVAGRILGYKSVGLASMVDIKFNVKINKKYQRANWGRRPLPNDMIRYARLDTHFLIPLRNKLKKELTDNKRWGIAKEDFSRLCETEPQTKENNGAWAKITGSQILSSQQLAILQKLSEYRDKQAKKYNVPPFKVLSNRTLVNIAVEAPEDEKGLWHVEGLSTKNIRTHSAGLLDAVKVGLKTKPVQRATYRPKPSEKYIDSIEALKNWRKVTGQKQGVPSDVILPRDILEMIAKARPKSLQELSVVMESVPGRFEQYGENIFMVISRQE